MKRNIPFKISKQLYERDHFECAWCGVAITERHHIHEWSKGGQHTLENLILLCPTCHFQVHNNEIDHSDLTKRRTTHVKGDRVSGSFHLNSLSTEILLGDAVIRNCQNILSFGGNPVIGFRKQHNDYSLFASFYDIMGNMVFWLSSNRYWATSDFTVEFSRNRIKIVNRQMFFNDLEIRREGNIIEIEGTNFCKGMPLLFTPNFIFLAGVYMKAVSVDGCGSAINID